MKGYIKMNPPKERKTNMNPQTEEDKKLLSPIKSGYDQHISPLKLAPYLIVKRIFFFDCQMTLAFSG